MSEHIKWSPEGLITYPEWSPKGLIASLRFGSDPLELIHYRLMTDPRMEKVWGILLKKMANCTVNLETIPIERSDAILVSLISHVHTALIYTRKPHETRAVESERYRDIAKLSKDLARKISSSGNDKSPFSWFPDAFIRSMLDRTFGPDRVEGEEYLTKEIKGKCRTCLVYQNSRSWFYETFMPDHPPISQLLLALADEASSLEENVKTEKRLVEKPNKISQETLFIRELYSSHWANAFGSPLYNTFATFCNVVFDYADDESSALTAARVRKALKGLVCH